MPVQKETDPRHEQDGDDGECIRTLMDAYPAPMTVAEIRQYMREEEWRVIDALNRLDSAGLIHRFGDLVLPTRAAFHAGRLEYTSPGS